MSELVSREEAQDYLDELGEHATEGKAYEAIIALYDDNARLREFVESVAEETEGPYIVRDRELGTIECLYCERWGTKASDVDHKPDCLYARAHAVLRGGA